MEQSLKTRILALPTIKWAQLRTMLKNHVVSRGIKSSTDPGLKLVVLSRSVLTDSLLALHGQEILRILDNGVARLLSESMINNKKLGILMGVSYNILVINLK
jgi:hypothetical protein